MNYSLDGRQAAVLFGQCGQWGLAYGVVGV